MDSKPSNDLKLIPQIYSFYKPLFERNISIDFVHPSADLSSYKLVIAPNLYLVDAATSANINNYVENGGTLLMSFFSGIVDENEHIQLGGYPAPFRDLLGLLVEEYSPFAEKQTNSIRTNDGQQFSCSLWADVIHTQSTEVLAAFEDDFFAHSPALTHNHFGKGHAYYLGTELALYGPNWLIDLVSNAAGISPVLQNLPAGVEALQRSDGKKSWLFLLNYTDKTQEVKLTKSGQDLITHSQVEGTIQLSPRAVAIIESDYLPVQCSINHHFQNTKMPIKTMGISIFILLWRDSLR